MAGKQPWSADELEILKKNYQNQPIEKMTQLLPNRSKDGIQWKASKLGLSIRNGRKVKADVKKVINFTRPQADYLEKTRNGSRIVREALNKHIKKNPL